MAELWDSVVGFAVGALVVALVRLSRVVEQDNEMYRRGYDRAVEDARARRRERDRRAGRSRS